VTRTRIAALLGATVLVLGACSSGDDDAGTDGTVTRGSAPAGAQPYIDSLVAGFTTGEDEDLQLTQEQAECVAPRWIDTIGVDRITEAGIAPEDIGADGNSELSELGLSEDEGNELYQAFGTCGVDLEQAFVDGIAMSGDLPPDVAACLEEQFDDDTLQRIMVITITKGEDALAEDQELTDSLLAVFAACPGSMGS
jgi:hypothetical protein